MNNNRKPFIAAALCSVALASCNGGGGVDLSHPGGVPPTPAPTGVPTPLPSGSTLPSPTPTGSHSPTPTPTPVPTASHTPTPVPTITPSPAPTQVAACSTATSVLGTYTSILSTGNVSGSTYTQNGGQWIAEAYTAATPAPTPSPTITPTPGPTATPTATPTPVTYVIYTGSYSVPAFSGTGPNGAFTTNVTNGCFILETRADGQPIIPTPPSNAVADGAPLVNGLFNTTLVGTGLISSFTVTGLAPSSGTGTFTLDNGTHGTATIQSSSVITFEHARRLFQQMELRRRLLRSR